jgi:hypothetical protein
LTPFDFSDFPSADQNLGPICLALSISDHIQSNKFSDKFNESCWNGFAQLISHENNITDVTICESIVLNSTGLFLDTLETSKNEIESLTFKKITTDEDFMAFIHKFISLHPLKSISFVNCTFTKSVKNFAH